MKSHLQGSFRSPISTQQHTAHFLHSPSPDRARSNVISPTISPSILQLTHHLNPPKFNNLESLLHRNVHYGDTRKYMSNKTEENFKEGDFLSHQELMKELKKVVNLLRQKEKGKQIDQYQQLKENNRILTIENQKLLSMIDKGKANQKQQTINRLQNQIVQITENMRLERGKFQQQLQAIINSNRQLQNSYQELQIAFKTLSNQNRKYKQKLQQNNRQNYQYQELNQRRQQQLKQTLQLGVEQITKQYHQIFIDLNDKISLLNEKIVYIEKITQTPKKSQIYIEDCPDSSNQNQKELSEIRQESLKEKSQQSIENNNLKSVNSSQSEKDIIQATQKKNKGDLIEKYQNIIQFKDEQIRCKDQQIKHLTQSIQKYQQETQKFNDPIFKNNITQNLQTIDHKVQQAISIKKKQISQLKIDTQNKIQQLIILHQNELQRYRQQIIVKEQGITKITQNAIQMETQKNKQVQTLSNLLKHFQQQTKLQKSQLEYKIINGQIKINELSNKYQKVKNQINNFKQTLTKKDMENQSKDHEIIELKTNIQYIQSIIQFKNQQISIMETQLSQNKNKIAEQRQRIQKIIQNHNQNVKQFLTRVNKFKQTNVIKQLSQFKQFVQMESLVKIELEINRIIGLYQNLSKLFVSKLQQIQYLRKQKVEQSEIYINSQKQRIALSQKVGYLQKVAEMYKKQLQDKNKLYEKVDDEKGIIQQKMQFFQQQKNKVSISFSQINANSAEFFQKIDRMIALERQRLSEIQIINTKKLQIQQIRLQI